MQPFLSTLLVHLVFNAKDADGVKACIQTQRKHHNVVSYLEEFMAVCLEAGVETDERLVWD